MALPFFVGEISVLEVLFLFREPDVERKLDGQSGGPYTAKTEGLKQPRLGYFSCSHKYC